MARPYKATELNEKQKLFLEWLLNPSSTKGTQGEFSTKIGVPEGTLSYWKKQELFVKEWEKAALAANIGPERTQGILDAMYDKAIKGDVRAAAIYFNMTERLRPSRPVVRELGAADMSDEDLVKELQELITTSEDV